MTRHAWSSFAREIRGQDNVVRLRKEIRKRIRTKRDAFDLAADMNATIVANIDERGSTSKVKRRKAAKDRTDNNREESS